MRIVVVDDEDSARARLRAMLESETDVELVAECESCRETIQAISRIAPRRRDRNGIHAPLFVAPGLRDSQSRCLRDVFIRR